MAKRPGDLFAHCAIKDVARSDYFSGTQPAHPETLSSFSFQKLLSDQWRSKPGGLEAVVASYHNQQASGEG